MPVPAISRAAAHLEREHVDDEAVELKHCPEPRIRVHEPRVPVQVIRREELRERLGSQVLGPLHQLRNPPLFPHVLKGGGG